MLLLLLMIMLNQSNNNSNNIEAFWTASHLKERTLFLSTLLFPWSTCLFPHKPFLVASDSVI